MIINIISYIVILYMIISYTVLYESYDGFVLLVIAIVLPLFSLAVVIMQRLTLKVRLLENDFPVVRCSSHPIRVSAVNKLILPVSLIKVTFTYKDKKGKLELGARAHATSVTSVMVTDEHCEYYDIKLNKIYIYDYFGLFRFRLRNDSVVRCIVLPRFFSCDEVTSKSMGMTEHRMDYEDAMNSSANRAGDDPSEIFDIREYQDGDRLKDIHHKLSSRMNTLMIKQHAFNEGNGIFYVTDNGFELNEEGKNRFDWMLEALNSELVALVEDGCTFGALLYNGDIFEKRQINTIENCSEYISDLIVTANVGVTTFTRRLLEDIKDNPKYRDSVVCYYSAKATNEEVELAYELEKLHAKLVLYAPDKNQNRIVPYEVKGGELCPKQD